MPAPILLVDDDEALLGLLRLELEAEGHQVVCARDGAQALELQAAHSPSAVVLDLGLPDMGGEEVLTALGERVPGLPVVILSARDDVGSVVDCMRAGATDFVSKPFDRARLIAAVSNAVERGRLNRENQTLRRVLRQEKGFERMIGASEVVQQAVALLRRAAQTDVSVLIEGESGTGKEVAARALHVESSRGGGPFVALNCGAIPETLIESELFGHERGAFTGASGQRKGRFEEANGGTLFLDEIGELKPDAQVRLLRVLQERQIQRLGSSKSIDVDVRIVAATHRDLRAMVADGSFREDLYYRLAVFPVSLPPLRERGDDVVLLATRFLRDQGQEQRRDLEAFSEHANTALAAHAWPGNVRELVNVVQRATILCDGRTVRLGHLPRELVEAAFPDGAPEDAAASQDTRVAVESGAAIHPGPPVSERDHAPAAGPMPAPNGIDSLLGDEVLPFEEVERRVLQHALGLHGGNVTAAASALGIGRATLYRKIERFGLDQGSSPVRRAQ